MLGNLTEREMVNSIFGSFIMGPDKLLVQGPEIASGALIISNTVITLS